jgi:tetratricopeptide (TPR) repeat protein
MRENAGLLARLGLLAGWSRRLSGYRVVIKTSASAGIRRTILQSDARPLTIAFVRYSPRMKNSLHFKLLPRLALVGLASLQLACFGPSGDEQVSQAYALLESGKYIDAERSFARVLQKEPSRADAHAGLGSALTEQDRCKPAIDALKHAIRLDETDAVSLTNMGWCQARLGDEASAIESYTRAAKLEPEDVALWRSLESLYEDTRDYANLLKLRSRLVDMEESPGNRLALGEAYCLYGEFAHCEVLARKLIEATSRNADAQALLGLALHGQGKLDEALSALRSAIQLQRTHTAAWQRMVSVLEQAGQKKEAAAAVQAAAQAGVSL